jgi:hypothetical protein
MEKQALNEKVEIFDVRGRDVRVFVSPSRSSLRRCLADSKYDLLRGFTYGDDIFFWDAAKAIHHQVWRQVTDNSQDVCLFMFGGSLEAVMDDAAREYSTEFFTFLEDREMGYFYTAQTQALITHPAFERLFSVQEIDADLSR